MRRVGLVTILAITVAAAVSAQGQRGRLLVTVADPTGAVIPDAKVAVTGLDDATKVAVVPSAQTSPEGVATFSGHLSVNSTELRNLNVGMTWQANSGYPYTETTGFDHNGDGIINDRPVGVGLWTLRGTPQSSELWRVQRRDDVAVFQASHFGEQPATSGFWNERELLSHSRGVALYLLSPKA